MLWEDPGTLRPGEGQSAPLFLGQEPHGARLKLSFPEGSEKCHKHWGPEGCDVEPGRRNWGFLYGHKKEEVVCTGPLPVRAVPWRNCLSLSSVPGIKASRALFYLLGKMWLFQSQNTCYIKSLNEPTDLSCSQSHWVREGARRKPGQGSRASGPIPHIHQHHPALGLQSCP